jgi:hypothetical protein
MLPKGIKIHYLACLEHPIAVAQAVLVNLGCFFGQFVLRQVKIHHCLPLLFILFCKKNKKNSTLKYD